ncbi:unnamed protein product [Boreogadus saida]
MTVGSIAVQKRPIPTWQSPSPAREVACHMKAVRCRVFTRSHLHRPSARGVCPRAGFGCGSALVLRCRALLTVGSSTARLHMARSTAPLGKLCEM